MADAKLVIDLNEGGATPPSSSLPPVPPTSKVPTPPPSQPAPRSDQPLLQNSLPQNPALQNALLHQAVAESAKPSKTKPSSSRPSRKKATPLPSSPRKRSRAKPSDDEPADRPDVSYIPPGGNKRKRKPSTPKVPLSPAAASPRGDIDEDADLAMSRAFEKIAAKSRPRHRPHRNLAEPGLPHLDPAKDVGGKVGPDIAISPSQEKMGRGRGVKASPDIHTPHAGTQEQNKARVKAQSAHDRQRDARLKNIEREERKKRHGQLRRRIKAVRSGRAYRLSKGFANIGKKTLGAFKDRAGGAVSSAVGSAVGATTRSGFLGSVAGTAAGGATDLLMGAGGTAGMAAAGALGAVALAAVGVVKAFNAIRDMARDATASARGYSGHIARADAMAEVRKIQEGTRRGREMGEELARLVDVESRMDYNIERIKDEILKTALPMILPILTEVNTSLKGVGNLMQALRKANVDWQRIVRLVNNPFDFFSTIRSELPKIVLALYQIEQNTRPETAGDTSQFLQEFVTGFQDAWVKQGFKRKSIPGGIF